MKGHWLRAGSWLQCGAVEDCRIEAGQPYLLIAGEGWTKARCQKHAGRPLPEDWEAQPPVVKKPLPFKSVGALASDWKTASLGERDE